MSLKYHITEQEGYLLVELTGRYSFIELKQLVGQLHSIYNQNHISRVLVDMTKIPDPFTQSMERFILGEEIARVLGSVIRLGVLADESIIDHFAETVAANRGVQIKVSNDRQSLLKWLLNEFAHPF